MKILSTSHIHNLAKHTATNLEVEHQKVKYIEFTSKELKPIVPDVHGQDVYLFHSLYHPTPNEAMMGLLLTNDALTRAGAKSISLVLPYMSYLRQDRQDQKGTPISARLSANLIEASADIKRIITYDLHSDQIQGFYSSPVDNLAASPVHAAYLQDNHDLENIIVVGPDFGSAKRTRKFASLLGLEVGLVEKQRTGSHSQSVESLFYIGPSPAGKTVALYDDMIDTAGTLQAAASLLYKQGAKDVLALATHSVFSKPSENQTAYQRLREAGIQTIITQSIERDTSWQQEHQEYLTTLSLDQHLANHIGGLQ